MDSVAELTADKSVTAFFTLRGDEEFLKDHFDGYPVMPGVLLLEALKQAASVLLTKGKSEEIHYRLVEVNSVRFGQFVKPGNRLKLSVELVERGSPAGARFKGRIDLVDGAGGKALTADFALDRL